MPALSALSGLRARPAFQISRGSPNRPAGRRQLLLRPAAVVSAAEEKKSLAEKIALPAAGLLAAALFMAATPDEALAARSGGRIGGSGFSRRSAPSRLFAGGVSLQRIAGAVGALCVWQGGHAAVRPVGLSGRSRGGVVWCMCVYV